MIDSVKQVINGKSPVGEVVFSLIHENGLKIENRKVPFSTVLIIYEARSDVSIEETTIALKAANKIFLKAGKNKLLVDALAGNNSFTKFLKNIEN